MSQLAESILSAAKTLPEGGLLSPKEFLHLGSRAAVDQTLTRLVREGAMLRVGRGLYALPIQSRFGARAPATQAIVQAMESANGEVIVDSGATEANALGLTTQVPTREVFLTSGPSRTLQVGSCCGALMMLVRALIVLVSLGKVSLVPDPRSAACCL